MEIDPGVAERSAKLASSLISAWFAAFAVNLALRFLQLDAQIANPISGLALLGMTGYGIYVAIALNKNLGTSVLWAVAMLIPCLNIVFIVRIQHSVVARLGSAYKVGLMGVRKV